jgi:hypothetical protein
VTSFDDIVGLPCTGSFGQGVLADSVSSTTGVVTLTCVTGVTLTLNLSTTMNNAPGNCGNAFGCGPTPIPWHESGSGTVTVDDGVHTPSVCSVNGNNSATVSRTCVLPFPTGTAVTITASGTNYTGLASEQVTLNADTTRTYSFPGNSHTCTFSTDCS